MSRSSTTYFVKLKCFSFDPYVTTLYEYLQAKMQKFPPLVTEMCGEVMQEYGFGDQDIMRGIIEIQVHRFYCVICNQNFSYQHVLGVILLKHHVIIYVYA
jgi:hypothetical protein